MKPSIQRLAGIIALTGVAVGVGATPVAAHDTTPDTEATARLTGPQRQVIRDATRRFTKVDNALAAGYLPTDTCVALPDIGGMGYHYVNPTLASDSRIDPTLPEILVYYRDGAGQKRLGAIEYFVADADQQLATDDDRPTLMGRPFEGPMPGHQPGMPIHYDLHVWIYKHNPLGELATWNPHVTCPT